MPQRGILHLGRNASITSLQYGYLLVWFGYRLISDTKYLVFFRKWTALFILLFPHVLVSYFIFINISLWEKRWEAEIMYRNWLSRISRCNISMYHNLNIWNKSTSNTSLNKNHKYTRQTKNFYAYSKDIVCPVAQP